MTIQEKVVVRCSVIDEATQKETETTPELFDTFSDAVLAARGKGPYSASIIEKNGVKTTVILRYAVFSGLPIAAFEIDHPAHLVKYGFDHVLFTVEPGDAIVIKEFDIADLSITLPIDHVEVAESLESAIAWVSEQLDNTWLPKVVEVGINQGEREINVFVFHFDRVTREKGDLLTKYTIETRKKV